MDTTVVYLHGIGGPDDSEVWLSTLNHELARAGYEKLARTEVIDVDYSSILDGVVGEGLLEPPVTVRKGRASEGAELAYIDNLQRFRAHIEVEEIRATWLQAAPSPLAENVSRLLFQVENYRSSRDVRHAVWAHVLARLPDQGRIVLIGHSLGSVIATDVACRAASGLEIAGLITVASPLGGVPGLRKNSGALATTGGFPYDRIRMWVNIFSPHDIVTVGRGISKYYPAALDVPIETGSVLAVPTIGNHALEFHAGHPAVASAVGWAVFGSPAPSPSPNLPVAPLDPMWEAHLITFAYANALLDAIPLKEAGRRRALRLAMRESARRVEEQGFLARDRLQQLADGAVGEERFRVQEQLQRVARYPTADMLLHHAAAHLEGRFAGSDLPSYAVALLHGLPLPPFEVEGDPGPERVEALRSVLGTMAKKEVGGDATRSGPHVSQDADPGGNVSGDLADQTRQALDEANKVMGISRDAWVKWAAMGAVGAALIAGTVITAGAMAPAGVAGAAAVTAALAAFGPGGMVGGIATIAALTSVGAAVAAGGGLAAAVENWEEQDRRRSERRAEIRAAITDLATTVEPQQLRASLAAFIAVVILQEETNEPSARRDVLVAAEQALAKVRSDLLVAGEIDRRSGYAKALEKKAEILERATAWLTPRSDLRALESAARKAVLEGGTPPF